MQDYRARISIPCDHGDSTTMFRDRNGLMLSMGYDRIVIGQRGPYVEFSESKVDLARFVHADVPHYYYRELRSVVSNVKFYHQIHRVDYADYLPGKYYASPFELYVDGKVLIEKLKKGK